MILGTHARADFQPEPWQYASNNVNGIEPHIDSVLDQDASVPSIYHNPTSNTGPPRLPQPPSTSALVAEERLITEASPSGSPLHTLRAKASTSSISSTSSSCSNTTAQTFMSTLSFGTITGQNFRGDAQEPMNSSYSASGSRGATEYEEDYDEGEVDDRLDLESLDVAILTPGNGKQSDPFEKLQPMDRRKSLRNQSSHHRQQQGDRRSSYASSEKKEHTRTLSQQSSGAMTVKQNPSMEGSAIVCGLSSPPLSSSSSIISRQRQSTLQQPSQDQGDIHQDMMFASPDYRKSMALSEHSDLVLDQSSPSGRGSSSFSFSDAAPQYTNLLRDATMIIEQQHLQVDIKSQSSEGNVIGKNPQRAAEVSVAESAIRGTPASSNKKAIAKSRSRRFSAPGHHGSSHTLLSKSSQASLLQGGAIVTHNVAGPGAPQAFDGTNQPTQDAADTMDGRLYLPGVHASVNANETEGSVSRHTVHPLQHHPTMQNYFPTSVDISTTGLPITASSMSQHPPHLHHDYRPGVVFEYYQGEWDWLPNFDEMEPDNAGIVGNFMIDDTTENDLFRQRYSHQVKRQFKEPGNFAVRFTTHIDITQDGVYSFWLSSNDGSVLYVANTLVVENDGMHYTAEAEGRIVLQAGKHPITVEFFHKNGKMLEGFRSTGPSLVVSYRAPGPIWSFGLKTGPKKVIKSSNLFYDHGDIRLKNVLREFGTDDYSMNISDAISPTGLGPNGGSRSGYWQQGEGNSQQHARLNRHRVMSGDVGGIQPSTRELQVQMDNAKTTIKDLEQIIRDQAESHKKKMLDLYDILQDTQAQVDRLVTGLKKASLFDSPPTLSPPNLTSNPTWRNTVVSVYVDAEEDYPLPEGDQDGMDGTNSGNENTPDADVILEKHLSDIEKLKQLYFFSMALSVKMNSEMMGKKTPEYTSTSIQTLYEDCTMHSKIPVEGWPGYVSRCFASGPRRKMDGVSPSPPHAP